MWTRTDRQRPTSPRKSVACMAQLLAGNNSPSNQRWAMSPKSPPINSAKRSCIFYWPQNHRATLFASSSARLILSEWAMATAAGPGAFIVNTGDTFITARWLLGAMAGGCADHRRGQIRAWRPGRCPPAAGSRARRTSCCSSTCERHLRSCATAAHSRERPCTGEERHQPRRAVACCAFRWLVTVGALPALKGCLVTNLP